MKLRIGVSSIPINDHITFSVDDIEATVTQIKEKGVVFNLEPIQIEGGMKLALKRPERGANRTGGTSSIIVGKVGFVNKHCYN